MFGTRMNISRFFILFAVAYLFLFAIPCCRQAEPEPVPISLMAQVDPAEPLGPWRLVAEVRGMRALSHGVEGLGITINDEVVDARTLSDFNARQMKLASRSMGKGGTFIQVDPVSTRRQPVAVSPGEVLVVGLRYGAAWAEPPRVEVRLSKDGEVAVAVEAVVDGHWCEAQLTVPPGGADTLEISHHLIPGTALPLKSSTVLAVDSLAHVDEISRARFVLRLLRGDRAFPVARVAEKRLFPLEQEGRTLDALLLSSGETREMTIPPALAGRRLLCWFTVLSAGQETGATLELDSEAGGAWQPLAALPVHAGDAGSWSEIRLAAGDLPSGCRRIRFSVAGGEAIVGLSGPLLPAGRRPRGRKNLLLIDLDTLRADRMETYGYRERPTTAGLDALLEERGFHLFEHAYSPAATTLPATAKFLSGRYHDIHQNGTVPRGYKLLQEWLGDAGYYCAAFTGGGQLRSRGFEQGFHEFYWSGDVGKIEDSFPQATAWLEENADELFFLFLHTYETHAPYSRGEFCADLPRGRLGDLTAGEQMIPNNSGIETHSPLSEPEKRYVNAVYDSCVKKATDGVAELLRHLDRLGLTESTVVVILSDHGEEFWDHNQLFSFHGQSLYGELLNVPLIIFDPDHPADGLQRIAEEVSTVDLLPTLLDLLGLETGTAVDGESLLPLMGRRGGEAFQRRIPIFASRLNKSFCVIADGLKYISHPGETPRGAARDNPHALEGELFSLGEDPGEQVNLARERPDQQRRMAELLRMAAETALEPLDEDVAAEPLNPDLQRQLQALGYVGGE